jgi:hypothetical protein
MNPGRRGGKPATNRFSYGAANCVLNSWTLAEDTTNTRQNGG